MQFPDLTIEPAPPKNGASTKGNQFTVTLLGFLCADRLWDLGEAKTFRPVWMAYAGPHQTCRSFTANFRAGRIAKTGPRHRRRRIEIPRSAPHNWQTDRQGETAITIAYEPELFHLEPAVQPETITFASMPPLWWLDTQARALRSEFKDEAPEVARAALFAAYLDRRSPLPIVQNLGFQLQLFRAALEQPWTTRPKPTEAQSLGACGLAEPILCHIDHDSFEAFLVNATTRYFDKEIHYGQARIGPDRRLLSFPPSPPEQLRLSFAA